MNKLLSMQNKNFHRFKTYKEYEQSLSSGDFLAYLDTYKWLVAMSDLLFFAENRLKDSDFYKTQESKEQEAKEQESKEATQMQEGATQTQASEGTSEQVQT